MALAKRWLILASRLLFAGLNVFSIVSLSNPVPKRCNQFVQLPQFFWNFPYRLFSSIKTVHCSFESFHFRFILQKIVSFKPFQKRYNSG